MNELTEVKSPPKFDINSLFEDLWEIELSDWNLSFLALVDAVRDFHEVFIKESYEKRCSIEKGKTVVDVGAHVGFFTLKAARTVEERGSVIAIEPEPENANLLRENVNRNNLSNVEIQEIVAGDEKGKTKLYEAPRSAWHSTVKPTVEYIEVNMNTLDNIISKLKISNPDFVKIDVEGAELEVLKGAENMLNGGDLELSIAAYHQLSSGEKEIEKIKTFLEDYDMKTTAYYLDGGPYLYAFC